MLTGVNQTGAKLQVARADEMGVAFFETTAHGGARPSHAEWQGRQFHRGGAVDYMGKHYPDFEAATGYGTGAGLCGWNCRHTFFAIFPELGAPPAWTQESLEALNARDIEYNGGRYTRYEISQMQRARERTVRKYKRRYLAEDAAGADTTVSAVKLRQARQELADLISATGGRADSARTSVAGFGRSESSKAMWAVKRQERLDAVNNDLTALRQSGKIKLTGTAVPTPALPNTLSFEGHAIEQMGKRQISLAQANEIAEHAILAISQRNGTQHAYYSEKGFIVIRQDGSIGTVGWLDDAGKQIVEVMKQHGF